MFDTQFTSRGRVTCCSGERLVPRFRSEVTAKGDVTLIPDGNDNLYEYIQSFKESCDINNIVARFARGDVDALTRVQGTYFDAVGMPTTYAELLNTVIAGRELYDSLPLEVKEKFGFSFERWMSSLDQIPSDAPVSTADSDQPVVPSVEVQKEGVEE